MRWMMIVIMMEFLTLMMTNLGFLAILPRYRFPRNQSAAMPLSKSNSQLMLPTTEKYKDIIGTMMVMVTLIRQPVAAILPFTPIIEEEHSLLK